ncbi:hypothetical protein TBK1r_05680 [Stieleria magnilauensis]|uniref:Uncharacterized protein n=1 Tax=Stieleria magnilauensis TaxID=2527963 RepID=A0ABX5XIF2_9BACT|nr:hypothetical protein TBK1r_05680 [Planctomycetes bacterium TBK1r]
MARRRINKPRDLPPEKLKADSTDDETLMAGL